MTARRAHESLRQERRLDDLLLRRARARRGTVRAAPRRHSGSAPAEGTRAPAPSRPPPRSSGFQARDLGERLARLGGDRRLDCPRGQPGTAGGRGSWRPIRRDRHGCASRVPLCAARARARRCGRRRPFDRALRRACRSARSRFGDARRGALWPWPNCVPCRRGGHRQDAHGRSSRRARAARGGDRCNGLGSRSRRSGLLELDAYPARPGAARAGRGHTPLSRPTNRALAAHARARRGRDSSALDARARAVGSGGALRGRAGVARLLRRVAPAGAVPGRPARCRCRITRAARVRRRDARHGTDRNRGDVPRRRGNARAAGCARAGAAAATARARALAAGRPERRRDPRIRARAARRRAGPCPGSRARAADQRQPVAARRELALTRSSRPARRDARSEGVGSAATARDRASPQSEAPATLCGRRRCAPLRGGNRRRDRA